MRIAHLVVGPAEHGVVRLALDLAQRIGGPVQRSTAVPERLTVNADLVHLHYTDRLFGSTCEQSADSVQVLLSNAPRVAITLHDLPRPSDGPALFARRQRAYERVLRCADDVVVCSEYESGLLDALTVRHREVIPLPIDAVRTEPGAVEATVGVLGFVYPGKGYDEVLAALPPGVRLFAIGRAADGHDDLAERLDESGVHVTGFVPDTDLTALLQRVGVPIAPHRAVSASASIGTWLAAGRRPLVPRVPYTVELARRCPGALTMYDDGLAAAIRWALAEPDSTWLTHALPGPGTAAVADAYRSLLAR